MVWYGLVVITVSIVRFDSLKSEGSIVAADQFFLSHADCDNRVSVLVSRYPGGMRITSPAVQIGLDTLALFLKKKSYGTRINNKLHCSHLTKLWLQNKFPLLPDKVCRKGNCNPLSLSKQSVHYVDVEPRTLKDCKRYLEWQRAFIHEI